MNTPKKTPEVTERGFTDAYFDGKEWHGPPDPKERTPEEKINSEANRWDE